MRSKTFTVQNQGITLNIFQPTFLVANDQGSQNACGKYPSKKKLDLPGGCALATIASAPASIIKCFEITSLTTTTPVVF